MATIKVNLTEELINAVKSEYTELRDEFKDQFDTVADCLQTLVDETHYDALVKFANRFISQIDEEVKPSAESAFQTWLDGSGNYHAAMELQKAGDDAVGTANDFERDLNELFDELWNPNPMGEEIDIDTAYPNMKDENYDELERIFRDAYSQFESITNTHIGSIESQGGVDPSYKTSLPAFYALTKPVLNIFMAANNKVQTFREENESLTSQQEQKAEEAVQEAIDQSVKPEDVDAALKMFGDDDY